MYRQSFSLARWPFGSDIASDDLFPSRAATEAQARLNHLAEMRGIGLLTGEVGSGKTAVCRRFADSLLLTGLTGLRRRLAMGVNESLAQRLVVRHHMDGLAAEEIEPYIEHRLRMAGAPDIPIFGKTAVAAIAQTAHGLPRRINQIAHNALAAAAADKAREVTDNHVARAIDELNLKA